MGLMAVALDLLLRIHPMSNGQEELKEMSSSRQDLKNDMQELEAAGFLKPCKETPDSWDFAQVRLREKKTLQYNFCCQFNEKPSIILGCSGIPKTSVYSKSARH